MEPCARHRTLLIALHVGVEVPQHLLYLSVGFLDKNKDQKLVKNVFRIIRGVISTASTRDEAGPGASGQIQDLQGHHQDDQEQLLDHF